MRFHRLPLWVEKLFPNRLWEGDPSGRAIYLTFDDGPVPGVTDWVLEELDKRGQVATFFVVGDNVRKHSELALEVAARGHSLGNHTFHHLSGWRNSSSKYLEDVHACDRVLEQVLGRSSQLFRPPYGSMRVSQAQEVSKDKKIVMWSLLSQDVEAGLSSTALLEGILTRTSPGKIIVFHDQQKTKSQLKKILPSYLDFLLEEGYTSRLL